MHIEVDDRDAAVLRDVLAAWLDEVAAEIRHTDNPGVRAELRERRDSVRRVHDLLDSPEQAAG